MKPYKEFVGQMIDQGKTTLSICQAILRAQDHGTVKIPIKAWAAADRFVMLCASVAPQDRQKVIDELVNQTPPQRMLYDSLNTRQTRTLLQSPAFSLRKGQRPDWQSTLFAHLPKAEILFGDDKQANLKQLGLLDTTGKWSEEQFQKTIRLMAQAKRRKLPINYYTLLLWSHGFCDLKGQYLKQTIPFDWLLACPPLSITKRQAVRRVAECMLEQLGGNDTRIKETIRAKEARLLEQALNWIVPRVPKSPPRYLAPLVPLAQNYHDMNWDQLERLLDFIKHQKKAPPDPELLRDFVDGYVDEKGRGKFRSP
ncbi:MAG: hypothetical protein COA84_10940 [Robiginitomaculum sp.]|nr:MAG: hypothetical protein COA84_10940 [Robiginitomaculum sp.]